MPFRRYKRTYRRNSKLTKANIYSNRGAKAQSKQIAALSRKVNYIAKVNRPEILTIWRNFSSLFSNSTLSSNFAAVSLSPFSSSYSGDDKIYSAQDIEGNFSRCKGISLKLVSQYSDNWRDSIADSAHDQNAGYRILILQEKLSAPLSQASSISPTVTDIFTVQNSISSGDENLTSPLVAGITGTYKILYSRVFTISRYHSTRLHNINISPKKCLNFSKDVNTSGSSVTGKGRVWVCILTGGLHRDVDYTANINVSGTIKIAYTDN